MIVILNKDFQLISDETALILFGIFLSYILFIVLAFIEKNHFSRTYKIVTTIFGCITIAPVFFGLFVSNGNILTIAITVLYLAALFVHIKKLKYKSEN